MRKFLQCTVAVLCLLTVAVGAQLVAASPAAAATCSYSACTGKDPHTTGCDADGETKRSRTEGLTPLGYHWLGLRYSPTCRAFWTKFIDDYEVYGSWDIRIKEMVWSNNLQAWQLSRSYTTYTDHAQTSWTKMLNSVSGRRYYACADSKADGSVIWQCTSYYQAS